jgi:putative oxidoreductase
MTTIHHAKTVQESGPLAMITGKAAELSGLLARIPQSLIALVGRFSIAAVFWKSGQTKVEGFAARHGRRGDRPRHSQRSPTAALESVPRRVQAAFAGARARGPDGRVRPSTCFPCVMLDRLATRLSAFGLLIMTLVIQVFVYPGCVSHARRLGRGAALPDGLRAWRALGRPRPGKTLRLTPQRPCANARCRDRTPRNLH